MFTRVTQDLLKTKVDAQERHSQQNVCVAPAQVETGAKTN